MKKQNHILHKLFLVSFLALGFLACDRGDETPEGKYNRGVFIINEGAFNSSNGSIDFIDPQSGQVESDIFGKNNNNRPTGDVIQDLRFSGQKGFIVANNSNKIEEITVESFSNTKTWEEQLRNPRFMVTTNDNEYGYISNWGFFDENFSLDQSYIAVADLRLNAIIDTIHTDPGAEQMFLLNSDLYVSNSFTNTVYVIDVINRKVTDTIEVGNNPKGIAVAGNAVWVLCQGSWGASNATLHRISPSEKEVTRTISLNMSVQGTLVFNAFENKLYFTSGKKVFAIGLTDTTAPSSPVFEVSESSANLYGIAYNPTSGNIWVCDPADFNSAGKVFEYKGSQLEKTYNVGIAPNGIRFR